MSALLFTVPGPIVSGNRASRIVNGRAVKSAEKRRTEERVRSISFAAALKAGWVPPERAAVYIVAVNSRYDADNLVKALSDGMVPYAIVNDNPKHLRALHIRHAEKDTLGERYEIRVEVR